MLTAREIADRFERLAPLDQGIPGDEQGFVWGDPATAVKGVACLWNVHTRSLEACVERGLNLIFCHESIWMPSQESHWYRVPPPEAIYSRRRRQELLERHQVVVYRCHSSWDALPVDGVPDQAVAALGIAGLKVVGLQKYFAVHELPEPLTMAALYRRVESGLGLSGCRLFGDGDRRIRRFAFLIGGFGENQFHLPQTAVEMGAEAIVIGEMNEFIVIACLEMGVPVIESLHSASEMPAIRRQAELVAAMCPEVRVEFVRSGALAYLAEDRLRPAGEGARG
jgi:putative NIF3 family GTP cyclohydrolase 1 type 2